MKAAYGLARLISKLEIETSLHACLNELYVETAIYCIISKEHGVSADDLITEPEETQKLLTPTPKVQPSGAYARLRTGPYGRVPEPGQGPHAAKRLKVQGAQTPAQPVEAHDELVVMQAEAEEWWPDPSMGPVILTIEEGEAKTDGTSSVEATLQYWIGHEQPICQMLDEQVKAVFCPVPNCQLGDQPVYKSEKGYFLWYYVSTAEEAKAGWYLSTVLWSPGALATVNTDMSS